MNGDDDMKKSRGRMIKEFAENFVIGGFLVMAAILVAKVSTPAIGGILAALPIRYGITWGITAMRKGKEFAEDMAKGSVIGMPGNLAFSIALYLLLVSSLDFMAAFVASIIAGIAVLILMKATFPR